MGEINENSWLIYLLRAQDIGQIERLKQELEMREPVDGPEIVHQALRYYREALRRYHEGYLPAFIKDMPDGSKHVIAVRVEPFVPPDKSLREIERNLD